MAIVAMPTYEVTPQRPRNFSTRSWIQLTEAATALRTSGSAGRWRSQGRMVAPSPSIAQILFLVGDAVMKYGTEPVALHQSREAWILVDTIQCGNLPDTNIAWKRICRAGEGQYFAIAQDGGLATSPHLRSGLCPTQGSPYGATSMPFGGGMMGGMGGAAFRKERVEAQKKNILMSIQGVRFADAWSNRVSSDFDGVSGHAISKADLIANKKAVGRPQDLLDVNNLVGSEPHVAQGSQSSPRRTSERQGEVVIQVPIDD